MIISHRHRFIFVHVARTGGRSLTVELEKLCGPDDIITPSGNSAGQNHQGWGRHCSARKIRERLGGGILDDYFVFAVERNPWDKLLSTYWAYKNYRHGHGGSTEQIPTVERVWRALSGYPWSFETWVKYRLYRTRLPGSWRAFPNSMDRYTDESGQLIVDAVFRHEHLDTHLEILSDRLGLEIKMEAREGGRSRVDRRPYTEAYTPWSRKVVEVEYANLIQLMGYRFGEPVPSDVVGLS